MNVTTTKREPKREPRGYVLPGSVSAGLGTLGHRRTGFRGQKGSLNRRFRPSPPSASSSSSRLSASPGAHREPKREPMPVADCSALKSAVADCKPTIPIFGPGENTVKPRVCANAKGTKRLKPAEAAHKTLTAAGAGRLQWRAA